MFVILSFISEIEESSPCQRADWQKKKETLQKEDDSIQDSEHEEPAFPFLGCRRNLDFSHHITCHQLRDDE